MIRISIFFLLLLFLLNFNNSISQENTVLRFAILGEKLFTLTDSNSIKFASSDRIRITNLGSNINSGNIDYAPSITRDGKILYFVSNRKGSTLTNKDEKSSHDIWAVSINPFQPLNKCKPFKLETNSNVAPITRLNTPLNEGVVCISSDNKNLFFTGCGRETCFGDCDIFVSTLQPDNTWGNVLNLGPVVNTEFWESQPCITPDGKRLYFVTNRPEDGKSRRSNTIDDISYYGWNKYSPTSQAFENTAVHYSREDFNIDIWFSDFNFTTNTWSAPKKLSSLNTTDREFSPFITHDAKVIFYASDRQKDSYGGFDFYASRIINDSTFSTPVSVGQPINTPGNDNFLSIPKSNNVLYFSSRRTDVPGAQGDYDLFAAYAAKSIISNSNLTEKAIGVRDRTGKEIVSYMFKDKKKIELKLVLENSSVVTINVQDINGNELKSIASQKEMPAGESLFTIDCNFTLNVGFISFTIDNDSFYQIVSLTN